MEETKTKEVTKHWKNPKTTFEVTNKKMKETVDLRELSLENN